MATGGNLTTSQIPNAIDRRIRSHFKDEYEAHPPMFDKILKVLDQEDYNQYEQDYQGLGNYEVTSEGETYKQDNVGEGFQTVYTPIKYTKSVPYTMEANMWDKAGLTKAGYLGEEMAREARNTIEEEAASLFNNGFDTAFTSYGDSKPLFSTDHTRPDGGTAQSNASATSVALSGEALEDAQQEFRVQKNKRGRLIRTTPECLLVPPALEAEALRITKSQQRVGTADNDTNVQKLREYYGGNMKVIVWDYLGAAVGGSDTAWFICDPSIHKVTWRWAKKPTTKRDETTGIQNDTHYFLGMFYASKGWSDWVGTWGSQGTGAAYSS